MYPEYRVKIEGVTFHVEPCCGNGMVQISKITGDPNSFENPWRCSRITTTWQDAAQWLCSEGFPDYHYPATAPTLDQHREWTFEAAHEAYDDWLGSGGDYPCPV
jgi:hypothetical protein